MASIKSFAACTCFQQILTEVEENGEGIQEIIDDLASGGSSGGGGIGGGSGGSSEPPSGGPDPPPNQIQSPNYPNFYPPSSNEVIITCNYFSKQHKYHTSCQVWNLEVAPGQQIELTFESFSLEPPVCEFDGSVTGVDFEARDMSRRRAKNTKFECGECSYDYVQISYGSANGYGNETYCGSDLPEPIISSGNTMTVEFVCDSAYQFTGFSATWRAVQIPEHRGIIFQLCQN